MFDITRSSLDESAEASEADSATLEWVAQRAALDLHRIVAQLAQRYLKLPPQRPGQQTVPVTWRQLLAMEEQALSDLGFQGRYPAVVRESFIRLAESRLPGADRDAPVDWQCDEDPLPAVYAIVRSLVEEFQRSETEKGCARY